MKKKRKLPSWKTIAGLALGVGLGLLLAMQMVQNIPAGLSTFQELGTLFIMLLLMYLTMFVQILTHEAGHLVFGLLTGYQFVSFRIFCFQLTRVDGRLKLGRHSIAGTGGQCLMAPPEMKNGKFPYVLYNLGGCLLNLITSVWFLILYFSFDHPGVFPFLCLSMTEIGVLFALTNGIPMDFTGIHNDGSNTLSISKNPEALKALWIQLKINEELSRGKRLKDLPEEWFHIPSDADLDNYLTGAVAAFACNRLLDQGRYQDAAKQMENLLTGEKKITGIYGNFLTCDLLCCELVGESRPEVVAQLYTEALRSFMKSMKTSLSIMRTQYIYALLVECDPDKAAAYFEEFEKIAKNYPYSGDMQVDRELMETARQKAKSEANNNG